MERINSGNVDSICAAMTADHIICGRAWALDWWGERTMRAGWRGYYQMVPDYKVSHEEIFAKGDTVAVFGTARGTYAAAGGSVKKENSWEIPAAWKAVVRNGQVAVWQVYADNQPVRKLMGTSNP